MKNDYELGQNFVLNDDYSFYVGDDATDLTDFPKGSVFVLNDVIGGSHCICCNTCKISECNAWHMIIFEGYEDEVRLTKAKLDEIVR